MNDNSNKLFIEWNNDFITGDEIIDDSHKEIIIGTKELYLMLSDTKNYKDLICEKMDQLTSYLLEHMAEEEEIIEKYNISNSKEHKESHDKIRAEIESLNKFNFDPLIKALMVNGIMISYLTDHFINYDKGSIEELRHKAHME